jgi:glucose-1-phosphate adenylyltransferase
MDYGPLIAFHKESRADLTIGGVQVPLAQADQFGVMSVDSSHRVIGFDEKPAHPRPMPDREGVALASMGIYAAEVGFLRERLERDAEDLNSEHDFGRNVIPQAIKDSRVFAYPFQDIETKAQAYWRDVGTVDAYYHANMELVHVAPELNLYDEAWPIWTYQEQVPGAKFVLEDGGRRGAAFNSMIAGGCIISGATIRESLLFFNVTVDEGTYVYRSVVLPHVDIGRNCHIANAIIDEGCVVPDGSVIGRDLAADARDYHVTEGGVVLVTPQMLAERRRRQA